jgi:hypothetical protein
MATVSASTGDAMSADATTKRVNSFIFASLSTAAHQQIEPVASTEVV